MTNDDAASGNPCGHPCNQDTSFNQDASCNQDTLVIRTPLVIRMLVVIRTHSAVHIIMLSWKQPSMVLYKLLTFYRVVILCKLDVTGHRNSVFGR